MSGDSSTNVHLRRVATNRQIAARAKTAPHQIIDAGRHNAGDLVSSQTVLKVLTLWDRHDLPHVLPRKVRLIGRPLMRPPGGRN